MDEGDSQESEINLRKAFTMRNNVARQISVNFMPSRQLPLNSTVRLRRSNSEHRALLDQLIQSDDSQMSEQADMIVREMEQNQELMENNIEAEGLRRQALRDLPQGLTIKRNVRAKLSASVSLRSKGKPLTLWKRFRYRISFANKRLKDRFSNFLFSIELWYEAIRQIEGNFGSAVGSYFYFFRYLFTVNVVMALLSLSFVVIPQGLHDAGNGNLSFGEWKALDYVTGKEILSERNRVIRKTPLCTTIWQYIVNISMTVLVLTFIAALNYGVWVLLDSETVGSLHWELIVSGIITIIVSASPVIFDFIVRLEFYTPRVALYVTLARTWLLDLTLIILLLLFWIGHSDVCWETSFGQEAYRLVLLEAAFSLFILPIFEFARGLFVKFSKASSAAEFNISYNSLTLIYNQAVLWFGVLYSPLLPLVVAIKMFLLFYVKKTVAMYTCSPARKVWRAAQTQTVMLMLVTLSLFVTLFALGSLYFRNSSQHCGPFTKYEYVYRVLSEGVLNLSRHNTLNSIIGFATKPGTVAFIMLFLCVAVYYASAKAQAQKSMTNIIRQLLVLEAKDKDFLLSAIAKVSNGEWQYTPQQDSLPKDSHTWKYLNNDNIRKPSNAGYHLDVSHNKRNNNFNDSKYEEGETDSSFSWQGSSSQLDRNRYNNYGD